MRLHALLIYSNLHTFTGMCIVQSYGHGHNSMFKNVNLDKTRILHINFYTTTTRNDDQKTQRNVAILGVCGNISYCPGVCVPARLQLGYHISTFPPPINGVFVPWLAMSAVC